MVSITIVTFLHFTDACPSKAQYKAACKTVIRDDAHCNLYHAEYEEALQDGNWSKYFNAVSFIVKDSPTEHVPLFWMEFKCNNQFYLVLSALTELEMGLYSSFNLLSRQIENILNHENPQNTAPVVSGVNSRNGWHKVLTLKSSCG